MRILWLFIGLSLMVVGGSLTNCAQAQNIFADDVQMCSGRPWIDITCNGADPTGNADSTSAISTTIGTAITNGWPVFFPAGTYKVTSKLTWDYQGIAGNGLTVISAGAKIDGRSIASGSVLQIVCSGGTTASPATCNNLRIHGELTIAGSTPAYVVVLGKTDFSDIHNAAHIDHLVVTNASTNTSAGAIQANYLEDGDLWLSGTSAGGSSSVAAVALEQVQTSRISGAGTSTAPSGANAAALLLENGSTSSNAYFGFALSSNTCLSITSAAAVKNVFVAPVFTCSVAVNGATAANGNLLLAPNYAGATTPGPLSGAISTVGRGSLQRYAAPNVSSYTAAGVDDGMVLSSGLATGSPVGWAAASLPVTLPNPTTVGAGWTMGFINDQSKAIVLTPPAGVSLLANSRQLSTLTLGPGNYEVAAVQSDGANFRILYTSQRTALAQGLSEIGHPSFWTYPSSGYGLTLQDNGNIISSAVTGGPITMFLPPTNTLPIGWSVGFAADAGNAITVQVNVSAGGRIINNIGQSVSSRLIPSALAGFSIYQFDGSNFRELVNNLNNQIMMTPNIAVSGSTVIPTNSAIFLDATRSGTSLTPLTVPLVYLNDTESITDTGPANNGIATLYIGKTFGTGEGVRMGILSFLTNTAPTAGGPLTDGNQFYTSIFGATAVRSTDGGNALHYRGDFYGVAGYVIAYPGSTYLHGVLNEFDASINAGASAQEYMILQLAEINNHAVHGTMVDAGLLLAADNTVQVGVLCGICFGKPAPYQVWPIDPAGTIIGNYRPIQAPVAKYGVNWSGVSFSDCAWLTVGVCLDWAGSGSVRLTHGNPEIRWNDTLGNNTTGALQRWAGIGSANQFQFQSNTAVDGNFGTVNVIATSDGKNFRVGPVTALSTTATGGFLGLPTSNGTPSGVPVGAGGGFAPIEVDTTNNKLCYYNGGWRCL